jgi:anti-sigma regulatory factor (Ser/Thr protein kinase)
MVPGKPSILNLRLNSRPDSAGLVRAVLGGLAPRFGLRPELLDDLKTVVSEACNNAVDHAYRGEGGTIAVHLDVRSDGVEATVRDWGGGFQHIAPAGDHMRVGLPLINALADRAEFLTAPGSGTEVRMGFDIPHNAGRAAVLERLDDAEDLEAWTPWRRGLSGDVVVTLLPSELLPPVLEALTSALAARSRFSLERFSDIYLVTAALTDHVRDYANSSRVSFAVTANEHQLTLTIGPLRLGTSRHLDDPAPSEEAGDHHTLAELADEVRVESLEHSELLRVVLIDRQRARSGASR